MKLDENVKKRTNLMDASNKTVGHRAEEEESEKRQPTATLSKIAEERCQKKRLSATCHDRIGGT